MSQGGGFPFPREWVWFCCFFFFSRLSKNGKRDVYVLTSISLKKIFYFWGKAKLFICFLIFFFLNVRLCAFSLESI